METSTKHAANACLICRRTRNNHEEMDHRFRSLGTIAAEYERRVARLAELIAEAEGDLELIGHYHRNHATWCESAMLDAVS